MRLRDQHAWADSVAEWGWSHNFDAREGIHHKETIDMNTASQPAVVVDTDQLVDGVIAQFSRNIEAGEFERDVEPALDALKKDLRAAIAAIEATPAPVKAEPIKPLGADELQEFCSGHSFEQDDYTVDVIRTVENRMQGFAEFVPADPAQRAAVKFYTDNPTAALFDLGKRRAAEQAEPVELSPEITDTARAALLWVLWHHQGGNSPVGQPIRFALGIGAHDRLNEHQIAEAKRWAAQTKSTTEEFHRLNPMSALQVEGAGAVAWQFRSQHSNGWQPCDKGTHDWCKTHDGFESRELHPPTDTSTARPKQVEIIARWACDLAGTNPDQVLDANPTKLVWHRYDRMAAVLLSKVLAAQPASTPDAPGLTIPNDCPHMIVFDDADRKPMMFAGHGARAAALKAYEQASASWNAHLFVCIDHNSRDERHTVAKVATPTQPVEKDADALDAARYRWLRKDREVTLITSYFGNGCVNKRIEQVEEIIDAAIDAARTNTEAS